MLLIRKNEKWGINMDSEKDFDINELIEKGKDVKYEDVLNEMNIRDGQDSSRAIAPTKAADDAIFLDNSGLSLEENVDEVIRIVMEKVGGN